MENAARRARRPTLVIVSGPPGAGKTTLTRALAGALRCPAICRDELKVGLEHTFRTVEGGAGSDANKRVYRAFFEAIEVLLEAGISLIAEAAFQHRLWALRLQPLSRVAETRIIRCEVPPGTLQTRLVRRLAADPAGRSFHQDRELLEAVERGELSLAAHEPIRLAGQSFLQVDTSEGYRPSLREILAFCRVQGE